MNAPAAATSTPQVATGKRAVISVIIIFHDAEATIAEAIDSVFAQSRTDWELILVDDGSTDGGADIVARYVRRDPDRIRCVRHEGGGNRGTGESRSLGLSQVQGRYVAFLDADDVFHSERLERHLLALEADPALVMVQSLLVYWHSWNGAERDVDEEPVFDEPAVVIRPPGMLLLMLATAGARVPGICSVTLRTDAVRAVGGFESSFRDVYEDQVLWVKLYLRGDVLCLHDRLAWYRQHPASLTHRARRSGAYTPGRPHAARERLFRWLEAYLERHDCEWPEINAMVHRELQAHGSAGPGAATLAGGLRALASRVLPGALHERLLATWGRYKLRRIRRRVEETAARVQREHGRAPRAVAISEPGEDRQEGGLEALSKIGSFGPGS